MRRPHRDAASRECREQGERHVVLPEPERAAATMRPRAVIAGAPQRDGIGSARCAYSRALSAAEPAAIVGVVERALAEVLGGEGAADEDQRRALDRFGGDPAAMSPSVPRTIRSSGQLARTTTATGQSAPRMG